VTPISVCWRSPCSTSESFERPLAIGSRATTPRGNRLAPSLDSLTARPVLPKERVCMRYTPHTEADRRAMLDAIGVERVEDLFADIPADLRFPTLNLPPGMS